MVLAANEVPLSDPEYLDTDFRIVGQIRSRMNQNIVLEPSVDEALDDPPWSQGWERATARK